MKLKVEVTQKDIDNANDGFGHRCFTCPTARALRRATGINWGVGAVETWPYWAKWSDWMPDDIYVEIIHKMPPIMLPPEVVEFEQKYDEETAIFPSEFTIKPYSFELDIPDCLVVNA